MLTLAAPLVSLLPQEPGECAVVLPQPHCYPVVHGSRYLDSLFAAIAEEYANPAQGSDVLLRSLVRALLVWLDRQLPQCCQQAGQSALQLILPRLLVYTALNVNRVADQLGFSEPAYFIRFFRRLTGQTPSRLHKRWGVLRS